MKRMLLLIVAPVVLLLAGCAHVLSREALLEVDPSIDYAEVKANPQAYRGKTLLLGGLIVDTRSDRNGSTLEILRYTVNRWGEPQAPDEAGGRFLARSGRFLDPEIYKPNRFVTLTGTVEGAETRPLEGYQYTYPVFRIGEIYMWSRTFYNTYPYYYPYGYYPYYPWGPYTPLYRDPFWYGPYW